MTQAANATSAADRATTATSQGLTAKTMMTNDVVLWSNGDVISGADAWANEIETTPALTHERLAPVSVEGDDATTFARFEVTSLGVDDTVVQVFQLRDGKIARVWQFVPGVTPPLDNALPAATG